MPQRCIYINVFASGNQECDINSVLFVGPLSVPLQEKAAPNTNPFQKPHQPVVSINGICFSDYTNVFKQILFYLNQLIKIVQLCMVHVTDLFADPSVIENDYISH